MIVVTARARVHRSYQRKAGGIVDAALDAGDADFPVFQGLAEHFKNGSVKFREFV